MVMSRLGGPSQIAYHEPSGTKSKGPKRLEGKSRHEREPKNSKGEGPLRQPNVNQTPNPPVQRDNHQRHKCERAENVSLMEGWVKSLPCGGLKIVAL